MNSRRQNLSRLFLIFLLSAALSGCGHGGTEVGNPPAPAGAPTHAPEMEDQASSPSPSPEAELHFDEDEANPSFVEETDS